jgi:hypothetical protein
MNNLVTLYHEDSVEKDVFGNVIFDGVHRGSLIFDDRLSQFKGSFTLVNRAGFLDVWS